MAKAGRRRILKHTIKTMVYLEGEAHRRLKHRAVDEGVSMTELIRRAVNQYLGNAPRKESEAIGRSKG